MKMIFSKFIPNFMPKIKFDGILDNLAENLKELNPMGLFQLWGNLILQIILPTCLSIELQ